MCALLLKAFILHINHSSWKWVFERHRFQVSGRTLLSSQWQSCAVTAWSKLSQFQIIWMKCWSKCSFWLICKLFTFLLLLCRFRGSWALSHCIGVSSRFWITATHTCHCTWERSPWLRRLEVWGQAGSTQAWRRPSPPNRCCLASRPTPSTSELRTHRSLCAQITALVERAGCACGGGAWGWGRERWKRRPLIDCKAESRTEDISQWEAAVLISELLTFLTRSVLN